MRIYTPEEVAELLKISKHTVYNLIKEKKLKAKKIGKIYRIKEEYLDEFLECDDYIKTEGRRGRKPSLKFSV